jgi:hypothetical protein
MNVQKLTLRLLFVVLGVAGLAMGARAQDLQVNDNVFFQSVTNPNQALTFSTSFVFNPVTGLIVPGTMTVSGSDPFGLGPFTSAPYNTSFTQYTFLNYFGSGNTWIQFGLSEFPPPSNSGPQFPAPGNYPFDETVLLCGVNGGSVAPGCSNFPGGYFAASGGTFTISPAVTPEPSMWLFLVVGVLLMALFEIIRRIV